MGNRLGYPKQIVGKQAWIFENIIGNNKERGSIWRFLRYREIISKRHYKGELQGLIRGVPLWSLARETLFSRGPKACGHRVMEAGLVRKVLMGCLKSMNCEMKGYWVGLSK